MMMKKEKEGRKDEEVRREDFIDRGNDDQRE